jgi:hypothetical protein
MTSDHLREEGTYPDNKGGLAGRLSPRLLGPVPLVKSIDVIDVPINQESVFFVVDCISVYGGNSESLFSIKTVSLDQKCPCADAFLRSVIVKWFDWDVGASPNDQVCQENAGYLSRCPAKIFDFNIEAETADNWPVPVNTRLDMGHFDIGTFANAEMLVSAAHRGIHRQDRPKRSPQPSLQ